MAKFAQQQFFAKLTALLSVVTFVNRAEAYSVQACDFQSCPSQVSPKVQAVQPALNAQVENGAAVLAQNLMKPATGHYQYPTFSSTSLLTKAFNDDDLRALSADFGIEDCRLRHYDRAKYLSVDKRDIGDCSAQWKKANLKTNALVKTASSRMAYRTASEVLSTNPTMKSIIEGKVSLDFSFSDIVETVRSERSEDARPQYVLEVTEKKIAVASGLRLLPTSGKVNTQEKTIVEKRIVERWPTLAATNKAPSSQPTDASFGTRLAKKMGVATVPFTRYRLKVEKTAPGLGAEFSFRFEERNELAYADITQYVMKRNKDGISWGVRLPIKAHSVGVEYANLKAQPVTYYRYYINDETTTTLSYHNDSNRYESVFKYAF